MAAESIDLNFLLELKERLRARESAFKEVDVFFAGGADRMAREIAAERLGGMATEVFQKVREALAREEEARRRSATTHGLSSIGIVVLNELNPKIAGLSWNKEKAEKALAAKQSGRQNSFGRVLIGVGKGGLPDDVHLISVSERERTLNRPEPEIIQDLQKRGFMLFPPEAFRRAADAVMEGLRQGKVRLPVSLEQLPTGLAIPRKATVGIQTNIRWVQQLPIPKDGGKEDQATSPDVGI